MPRVSVIIPCFNLGQFLGEAVESVRAQTWDDYDLTIVDDGSTDGATASALSAFERAGTRVIRSTNRGLSAARNLGIAETTGEFVCSLDADDRLRPEWLERAVAELDADPGLAFVSHWLEAFGDEHWEWKPVRCDLGMLLDVNVINGAALVRRSVVGRVGGFDESMRDGCEDWDFWIRVMERGYRGIILPEAMYQYRRRRDSMSREMNRTDRHVQLYAELVEKHPDSYGTFLLDLLLRREWTTAVLCHTIGAAEEELRTAIEPALEERRREIERGKKRLADCRARGTPDEERRRFSERVAQLEWEVQEERRRAEWLSRERAELIERVSRAGDAAALATRRAQDLLAQQADDFRRSWSWRLTAPLRRFCELLRAGRGQ